MRESLSLLLIEDDVSLNEELGIFLSDFFDTIDSCGSAEEAYAKYLTSSYDLVITDIQLPNQNGLSLVEKIKKKNPSQMVIVISAYKEVDYFLKSIDLGIYSFLTKPFDSQLLINTMIKATNQLRNQKSKPDSSLVYLHEGVSFDMKTKALHVNEMQQELTTKEELLLYILVKNANTFVRNEQLAQTIWQSDEVNNSTLRALVKRLRDKLGYDECIINLKNRGYKLTAHLS
ncbi:response regulator transcription factor [Sulfurospirillum oryzae]|uniref:response regulator transcription factor n=1 Tax=Sulfurospirillum oryzae TaxID=2976535 RepID=UPI0021E8C989|nr:response regulator transcription factor [Sulfurospirillum oryzae]